MKLNIPDIRKRLSNNTAIDAKEIQALCDEVESNQWIDVKERLPKKSGFYLISNGVYVKRGDFITRYKKFFDVTEASDATHWKPLPKPPTN